MDKVSTYAIQSRVVILKGQTTKPAAPEISDLLDHYAREAYQKFPTADKAERDKICFDLEALAQFERMDITTALKHRHRELLVQIQHHQQGFRD